MKRFALSLMLAGAVLGLAACKKTEEAAPAPATDASPALVNENPEGNEHTVEPGAAQTAAGNDPTKEEVKP